MKNSSLPANLRSPAEALSWRMIAAFSGRVIDQISVAGAVLAGFMMLFSALITSYEIVMRYFFNSPTDWTLELGTYILIWFGLLSMAFVEKENRNIHVDLLVIRMSPRTRTIWDIMCLLFSVFFVLILTAYGYDFFQESFARSEVSPSVIRFPMWVPKLAIPLGGALLILQFAKRIVGKVDTLIKEDLPGKTGVWDNPFFLIPFFLALAGGSAALYFVEPMIGFPLLVIILLFGGLPIFVALALVGAAGVYFLYGGAQALFNVPNVFFGSLNSYALACLPLFILAGVILESSGAGEEFYTLFSKWIGTLPGGLGVATIFSCAIFAAISISSAATAAAIGLIALPALAARNYDKRFSYGLMGAGGTLGIMIPPSGTMIIYSMVTEESLGKLFIAGLLPGLVLVALFSTYAIFFCSRTGKYDKVGPFPLKEKLGAVRAGIWALLAPVIILAGIYSGVFTPLEAAAVVVVYALIMSIARGKIRISQIPAVLARSTASSTMILVIISGALIMGLFMTYLQVPQKAMDVITTMKLPPWSVIVATMIGYIILGMFLEVVSAMMITLPVIYPLVTSLGYDGIWYAVLVTINMELACLTPPVGLNLYVIQGIARAPLEAVVRGSFPFYFLLLLGMLIIGLFPQLSTWLPNFIVR